ncbi:MAG: hypothetical protein JSR61_11545 [Proteobacteria bacterium]|nr:hypothetical protein [Pseudomonadota bacterium]
MNGKLLGLVGALFCIPPAVAQVTNPPANYGPVQKMQAVAHFGCGPLKNCEITCSNGSTSKTMKNLEWALVYKYANSDRLFLYAAGGPNEHYLIDGSFCDFSKILKVYPLD